MGGAGSATGGAQWARARDSRSAASGEPKSGSAPRSDAKTPGGASPWAALEPTWSTKPGPSWTSAGVPQTAASAHVFPKVSKSEAEQRKSAAAYLAGRRLEQWTAENMPLKCGGPSPDARRGMVE